MDAVKLPPGEVLEEWIAVNTVDFYNAVSMLYGGCLAPPMLYGSWSWTPQSAGCNMLMAMCLQPPWLTSALKRPVRS